jgi:DNA-binding transcriptional LysR family regulator
MTTANLFRADLNLFVVFDTICAEGSITRAAKRLNLSQPAISHALARLRQLFGDPLFTRRGHAMAPTPLARRIVEPVRQALRQMEAALNKESRFDARTARKRFTVGMRDVLEAALLPVLMRGLAASTPGIELAVVRAERRELEGELAAGTLDAAIDVLLPLPEGIRRERLGAERLVVVARRGHPALRGGLSLKTYLAQEHIQVSSRRRGLSVEDVELARHDLRRRVRLRCQHYFAACRVVSETDLVLTMPERYARIINPRFGNRLLPFPLMARGLDTYLYWHANAEDDPASQWLREQLRRAAHARP